jgi:hypothetical protein
MLFADMLLEVYTITNRPDLIAETKSALRMATAKLHSMDNFARDLVELTYPVAPSAVNVVINTSLSLPTMKGISYIRDTSGAATPTILPKLFTPSNPRMLSDSYGVEILDIWWLAGTNLNIKSSTAVSSLAIGYYANPVLLPEVSYSSWIANLEPYAIILEAAAYLFRMTGNAELQQHFSQQAQQAALSLRNNYLNGQIR